jgi:2-C-methyl-D-erythritol 4-phosphate cytidylyltransferase/2-C-methyl-D-erythritol 2,4-cyclodiphosphate synthase
MTLAAALIVAAGRGSRFGGSVPKQYLPLAGTPVLRRAVLAFADHPAIGRVRVVIHPDDAPRCAAALAGLDIATPITGGASRQDSVRLGLESLADRPPGHVLIHDAARPLVDAAVISRVLAALATAPAAIAAVPVTDTLKRGTTAGGGLVAATVARDGLWRAQTPQGFHFAPLLAAHRLLAGEALTDDAAVAERAGMPVTIVPGSEDNMKLTTEADFARAERFLAAGAEIRTGLGFDVHRFGPGDHVMLGGIAVPHDAGLEGHSDADVALHALTDALLGSIAAGDIGLHFPPGDPRWRGAASAGFVSHAARLVRDAGGSIVHVDLTIICERPRLGPYREPMRGAIAAMLAIPATRVSIKATTTERLGFTGRGEGIAAHALATVRLTDADVGASGG